MEILLLSGTVVLSYSLTRREGQEGNFIFLQNFFPTFYGAVRLRFFPPIIAVRFPSPKIIWEF